ncbi:flagellar motor switch phosphatase FliY [Clostridium tyrobutyricum]|uniref:Flagellar motor switch protein FliN n=1 Tax=Clostridium tyrobutyricum DIVETGP TaxID=1408889 RepID=W6NHY6_CLOTY|nr:flagellar motor switch phosphatase FliY [Clostridium tyrobutyricum]AND85399.1 flagellar motor switch protein [Clostridium tyrobutyricum]ANP69947.1 flagellar motor switch phosphatase FliY [Clostridium tyrobutyricum]MBV4434001.1 flagellar motor switch phosphatase FliY [Clostridium tyrobutyricum]MBV4437190.1 flagellar motor switch phosphatase FliY [Clostridium tyrobutyricum]MCH4199098.1 flagellar motor switch phosphatase FliY [Clostridium tyrobutyricum]
MSNDNDKGFLSQEEIDALLNGGESKGEAKEEATELSDVEKDLLGEVGNISMGSASTALSTIINQPVNITTPVVTVTTLNELKNDFKVPNIALEVKYTSGIVGENLLVIAVKDAAVIANFMMGGDGTLKDDEAKELSEIQESAVSEAMNQMIGSAATSMATMFMREVNISPPKSQIWTDVTEPLTEAISPDEPIVRVSFSLKIGNLVDSSIMQILPVATAKKIVSIMMGQEKTDESSEKEKEAKKQETPKQETPKQKAASETAASSETSQEQKQQPPIKEKPIEVQQAAFQPLESQGNTEVVPKNIDLIMDVPLQISVVLGRTKKKIKDILNLGTGSLIELDKLAEEPVEILVNGKKVAYGEVVVIDENFGVRITGIVSNEERIKSLHTS